MSTHLSDLQETRDWSRALGIEITDHALQDLNSYLKSLKLWSAKTDLVGSGEGPLLVRKHLADSIAAASLCPLRGRAADLGSGAGLPGIPVAILRPKLNVDLVESRAKRASFLADASHGHPNIRVLRGRIEELPPGTYDIALARALAPLDRLLPLARPLLRDGGLLLALKSSTYTRELSDCDPTRNGFSPEGVSAYRLPSGEDRVILRYRAIPTAR